MIRFYRNQSNASSSVGNRARFATALCDAQRWIRNLTSAELKRLLDEHRVLLRHQFPWKDLEIKNADDRPFADPYF